MITVSSLLVQVQWRKAIILDKKNWRCTIHVIGLFLVLNENTQGTWIGSNHDIKDYISLTWLLFFSRWLVFICFYLISFRCLSFFISTLFLFSTGISFVSPLLLHCVFLLYLFSGFIFHPTFHSICIIEPNVQNLKVTKFNFNLKLLKLTQVI